jgi:hypothetical protein
MGELSLGGRSRPVTEADLARYQQLQDMQSSHRVPLLHSADQPHTYVYLALFDGTGQDMNDPRQRLTNVGKLAKELETLRKDVSKRIDGRYIEGIGTQSNPVVSTIDSAFAFSWDEKLKDAYRDLADQTRKWRRIDPDAQIAIAAIGYSRGGVLVPGLLRLADQYGITDPDDLRFGRDIHGNLTVESALPPLVPPGQVPQIAGLFDPVATNLPRNYDARLNPRVLSAFSILAADEARELFPHQTIVDPGLSTDGRLFNAHGAGGHANIGGGNADPLLETLAFNAMANYVNTMFETPVVRTLPLPSTFTHATAHQVGGVTAGFGLRIDRDDLRDLRDALANCRIVDPCKDAEPLDTGFAAQFEWRTVQPDWQVPALSSPVQATTAPPRSPSHAEHPDHARLQQIRTGVRAIDAEVGKAWDDASERLSRSLLAASKDGGDTANVAPDRAAALARIDHVALGTDGRYVFAVQGGMQDPAHRFVGVLVEKALRTPVEQSDTRLDEANARIAEAQTQMQTQAARPELAVEQQRMQPALTR